MQSTERAMVRVMYRLKSVDRKKHDLMQMLDIEETID